MTSGRLIAVVGPSGVGKDSVMSALVDLKPGLTIVRRVITRKPGLGGEDYDAVDDAEFSSRAESGAFCLHWQAHGLWYGIPVAVQPLVAAGKDMLVNLSRAVLGEAQRVFPTLTVLHLTAKPETLAERLQGRGREDLETIRRRLDRAELALPAGVPALKISNDGPLNETVEAAMAALYPARV
ncbi:phosphonate metabolism protein/1,5-bisphosphokinase (PRPP-forming) PhnN [Pseudoruegeria sp. HB172150]|uniref:phosphonate metabolism protein/1,5-bisphosphokinase (PRPP-forming) PhnN n=1 Tax=Pseudoruegeria sp. HB172150 TaxID=2721164 RepID=UPI0015519DD9